MNKDAGLLVSFSQALAQMRNLRSSVSNLILPSSRQARIQYFLQEIEKQAFLKNPDAKVGVTGAPNPLTDPEGMERMMAGLKSNMMMVIPQTGKALFCTCFTK